MRILATYLVTLACFVFCACSQVEVQSRRDLLRYIADRDNGLVKEKTVSGLQLAVKYIPGDLLALSEAEGRGDQAFGLTEDLRDKYAHTLTFLLRIGPAKGEHFDITRLDVKDYKEFADRLEQLVFKSGDWMTLTVGSEKRKPALVRMENINAQEQSRNFVVAFELDTVLSKTMSDEDLCFEYSDELFHTGTSKFLFKGNDLENIPQININSDTHEENE